MGLEIHLVAAIFMTFTRMNLYLFLLADSSTLGFDFTFLISLDQAPMLETAMSSPLKVRTLPPYAGYMNPPWPLI